MADDSTVDVQRLPTLTEVLEFGQASAAETTPKAGSMSTGEAPAADFGAVTEMDPVAQVLALLESRIGPLLETRLREALAPALARAADGLIRDVRAELAPTLRSLVEEAVAQALRQPHSAK
jgi:hypothetical protein